MKTLHKVTGLLLLVVTLSACSATPTTVIPLGSSPAHVKKVMGVSPSVTTHPSARSWRRISHHPYPVGTEYIYRFKHLSLTFTHTYSYFVFDKNDRLIYKEYK